jgi:hypothetical protein
MTQRVVSCCLYIHRSQPIVIKISIKSIEILLFTLLYTFCPSFRFSSHFYFVRSSSDHHNSLSCHGSCSPSWSDATWSGKGRPRRSQRCPWLLPELMKSDSPVYQTGSSSLPNRIIRFAHFRAGAFSSCSFCVWTASLTAWWRHVSPPNKDMPVR